MNFPASGAVASPFVMASDGLASACCQIFDNVAFLSVTLAPKTTGFPARIRPVHWKEGERAWAGLLHGGQARALKVIGKERLENLSHLTDRGVQMAKRAIMPISLVSGLLLMLFLLFA